MSVIVRPDTPASIVVSGAGQSPPIVSIPTSEINVSLPTGQPGPQGEKGDQGAQGVPGDSSSALGYTHIQGVPSAAWTIVHPLSYYPNVTVVDSTGSEVEGDVLYNSSTTLTVTFSGAFSGTAYLS